MFIYKNEVWKSDILERFHVGHAFSAREGGVSSDIATKTMNVGFGRGDSDETVRRNMEILCEKAKVSYPGLICSAQYHSSNVRYVTEENFHEGVDRENAEPSDGFVTDRCGVSVMVRVADCVPILLAGEKHDQMPIIGAIHAGWRGTVGGIASNCVEKMLEYGAVKETLCAAIGPHIGSCCFEVRSDFVDAVVAAQGSKFAKKHISSRDGKLFADLTSMNFELLTQSGISSENIDCSTECTACHPDFYHSHRATGGKRGTMGAVIGIL